MFKIIKDVSLHGTPYLIEHESQLYRQVQLPTKSPVGQTKEVMVESVNENEHLLQNAKEINMAAREEYDKIVQEAKIEAEKILISAQEDGYQKGFATAESKGFDKGYNNGILQATEEIKKQMQDELAQAVRSAQVLLENAHQEANEIVRSAEPKIIEIAFSVASKILATEYQENPFAILPIVKVAMDKVINEDKINLRVAAENFDLIIDAKSDLQTLVGRENELEIIADPSLSVGDCVIDTPNGNVDAKLSTRLNKLKLAVQDIA